MQNLIEKLKSLKNMRPDPEYAQKSRHIILSSGKNSSPRRFYLFMIKRRLQESLNFGLIVGLTALLLYMAANSLPTPSGAVANENQQNIDIHLNKAQYYKEIAPNVFVVVMEDASDKDPEEYLKELIK